MGVQGHLYSWPLSHQAWLDKICMCVIKSLTKHNNQWHAMQCWKNNETKYDCGCVHINESDSSVVSCVPKLKYFLMMSSELGPRMPSWGRFAVVMPSGSTSAARWPRACHAPATTSHFSPNCIYPRPSDYTYFTYIHKTINLGRCFRR